MPHTCSNMTYSLSGGARAQLQLREALCLCLQEFKEGRSTCGYAT